MYQEFDAVGAGVAYRDLAEKLVHLATAGCFQPGGLGVTNGGSGYADGDILEITHASGTFPCRFAVSAFGGVVVGVKRIVWGGSFSNRVKTVAIHTAGTGYALNDVVQVGTGAYPPVVATDGAALEPALVKVTGVSGGAVTSIVLLQGGSYTASVGTGAPPLNDCATFSGVGTGSGTGLTLDLTMQDVLIPIGVTPGNVTGTGSGATFGGALSFAGWTALRVRKNYSLNSVGDEWEIILQGQAQTGGETPIIGLRTGTNGSGGTLRNFVSFTAFSAFNSLSTYDGQPDAINPAPSSAGGQLIGFLPAAATVSCFVAGSPRSLRGCVKAIGGTTTAYHPFYVGLVKPMGTTTELPWPMIVWGSMNGVTIAADSSSGFEISGPTEAFRNNSRAGPRVAWSQSLVDWVEVSNAHATSGTPPFTVDQDYTVYPVNDPLNQVTDTEPDLLVADGGLAYGKTLFPADGSAPTILLKPTPGAAGAQAVLMPVVVNFAVEKLSFGTLEGIFAVSGTKEDGSSVAPEDLFVVGTALYKAFPNGSRVGGGSWWLAQMGL